MSAADLPGKQGERIRLYSRFEPFLYGDRPRMGNDGKVLKNAIPSLNANIKSRSTPRTSFREQGLPAQSYSDGGDKERQPFGHDVFRSYSRSSAVQRPFGNHDRKGRVRQFGIFLAKRLAPVVRLWLVRRP